METPDIECLKPIPNSKILSDITQDNINYYRQNIEDFIVKCQQTELEINLKRQETQTLEYIRLVHKDLEVIPKYYIFKTDITKYFATTGKTFGDYMTTIHNDLYRSTNSFILFDNHSSEPRLLELTNKDRFYIEGETVDYFTILKYSISLFNTLFMSNISSKIESSSDLLSKDCCNINQLSNIKIVDPNEIIHFNDDTYLLEDFSKIEIPSNIKNRQYVEPNNPNATIIKCVLSNLVFIHQLYKMIIKRIISSYYKKFFNANNEDLADIFIKGDDYDYCINRQDKSITIIFNINYKDYDNIKFIIGKLSFIIYCNTLEQITTKQLNDSYIIIETYEHVNTKEKFELIFKNLSKLKKNIVEYKPSISNKVGHSINRLLTRSQNKNKHTTNNHSQMLKEYYNTIPYSNIPNVEKLSQAQLYTRISGKLTDYITTIFNFIIHTSPYKNSITKRLFNLEEKQNYETNTIDTNQIEDFDFDQFEFEDTNNKPSNIPKYKENEHGYKMYFCADDPNNKEFYEFNTSNTYLGEKLYHFFKAENDKNLFIGFIMNLPNNSIPSKAYSLLSWSSVKGHLNTFIIDKKNKLIIRFEPKGKESIVYCNVTKNMIIDYIIKSISQFWGKTHHPNSKYISDELKNLLIYKYIDTSSRDINIVQDNNTNTRKNSITTSTSRKHSLKAKPVHFPQSEWRDDNCQTYSLYGALLYAMNYDNIDVENTQESIHNTIFKLFSQITKKKSINLQYFLKDKLDKLMPVFTESREEKHEARLNNMEATDIFDEETESIKNKSIPHVNPPNMNNAVVMKKEIDIPIMKYTDEIKTIDTNIKQILDIIRKELENRSKNTNNRSIITNLLKYYIDNFKHIKLQYDKIILKNINTKEKLHSKKIIEESPEAQNYYQFLLEANFLSKILTLLNYTAKKQYYLKEFSDFLEKTQRHYTIDTFNRITNVILKDMTQLKNNNNKTRLNKQSTMDIGDINKIDIVTLDTPEHKKTIEDIFYDFEHKICKNQLAEIEEKEYMCQKISTHIKKLEETYKAYLNSQKLFSSTKKNKKTLEQDYYRLLLECDLISQILKLENIKSIEKANMLQFLLNFIKSNSKYNISKFNSIKDYTFTLVESRKARTSKNINNLLKKHRLTKTK